MANSNMTTSRGHFLHDQRWKATQLAVSRKLCLDWKMVDLAERLRGTVRPLARRIRAATKPPLRNCPDKLNFGCGYDKKPGYLNVDIDPDCKPDLLIVNGDLSRIPRKSFSEVIAKDVIEHVRRPLVPALLLDFADFLRPRGRLIVQTSSILHVAAKLQSATTFADQYGWTICLFGNQAHVGDCHYIGFTEMTLRVHLEAAGFCPTKWEMRDDWMFYVEADKMLDWTDIDNGCPDEEFVKALYSKALYREATVQDIVVHCRNLRNGANRKAFARSAFSAPERLSTIAKQLGL